MRLIKNFDQLVFLCYYNHSGIGQMKMWGKIIKNPGAYLDIKVGL
jgi:hypothetical protein